MDEVARVCPLCGRRFTIRDLVEDPSIEPLGVTFVGDDPQRSVYYFTHDAENCRTTFTTPLSRFSVLIDEPIPETLLRGTPKCTQHCGRIHDLEICDNECSNAPYRRFLVNVLAHDRKKSDAPDE